MDNNTPLEEILLDLSGQSYAPATEDNSLTDSSVEEASKYGKDFDERNHAYSVLLNEYIITHRQKETWKKWYKLSFFVLTMLIFTGINVTAFLLLWRIASKTTFNASDISVTLGSVGGIISSIIVLPKIIANHLFPVNEEEHILNMVQKMQEHDENIITIDSLAKEDKE